MRFCNLNRVIQALAIASVAANMTVMSSGEALAERTIRLDAGSVIPVRLNDTLNSSESRKGDTFTATVKATDGEDYGLPAGTKVDGVVTGARPQRDKEPGVIEVSFQRIRLPDGHSYAIDGSLIGLDNKSVERRTDGRLIAKPSHRNDRLTYAGYGAGAGLIVGLLTKRPLEDALLGGLLGYGFSALQKGQSNARDVVLKPGTEMGVRIDRRATLTSYDDYQTNRDNRGSNSDQYRVSTDRHDYGTATRSDTTSDRFDQNGDITDSTDVGVLVDDRDVTFDSTARPIVNRDNVVLVPAIPVLRAARIPYTYDSHSRSLRATGTIEPVRAAVGSRIAVVNGTHRVRLEAPVQRINGEIYVPMKYLALATGYSVHYDSPSRTVVLTSH